MVDGVDGCDGDFDFDIDIDRRGFGGRRGDRTILGTLSIELVG